MAAPLIPPSSAVPGGAIRKKPWFKENRAGSTVVGLGHDITNMDVVIFMILYGLVS
jgi:hypothetical protein